MCCHYAIIRLCCVSLCMVLACCITILHPWFWHKPSRLQYYSFAHEAQKLNCGLDVNQSNNQLNSLNLGLQLHVFEAMLPVYIEPEGTLPEKQTRVVHDSYVCGIITRRISNEAQLCCNENSSLANSTSFQGKKLCQRLACLSTHHSSWEFRDSKPVTIRCCCWRVIHSFRKACAVVGGGCAGGRGGVGKPALSCWPPWMDTGGKIWGTTTSHHHHPDTIRHHTQKVFSGLGSIFEFPVSCGAF